MKLRILFGFLICAGVVASFFILLNKEFLSHNKEGEVESMITVRFQTTELKARIAKTTPERAQGLAGALTLVEDEGMLFVFGAPGKYSIWMKGMRFPIDVIWIDENKKIIDIREDARPESYPAYFTPRYPAQYVLEVNAGFGNRHQIKIGDAAEFSL
ncbi:MAG: DUF192 domain-containing protein [Candidatus Spechtbacteria bacterium]|nr:DUF192 domain-containing protein [Candidatus Spechtbacteria bacterium]